MHAMQRNEATGYLEPQAFTSERKVEFLRIAREYIETTNQYPKIHELCRAVGVTMGTFENHLSQDEVFRKDWKEIVSILKSVYTTKLAVKADTPNGIVANLAILKFLESGSFIDRFQVNSQIGITGDKRGNEALIIDIAPEITPKPLEIQNNSSATPQSGTDHADK